jgi:Putative transposase
MRLDVGEFMRRFLLHVLPTGFHRIRHYGLFANGHRADKLTLCRRVLDVPSAPTHRDTDNDDDNAPAGSNHELPPCPCCGGRMIIIEVFGGPLSRPSHVRRLDGL